MSTISLDDLEERSRLAKAQGEALGQTSRGALGSPEVTLALIARIRELEAVAETVANNLGTERQSAALRLLGEVLGKGTVLP